MKQRILNVMLLAPNENGLGVTVQSLYEQRRPMGFEYHIHIVTQCTEKSVEKAEEMLSSMYQCRVIYVPQSDELHGFADCLAAGLERIKEGALLICRADTVYSPNALSELCKALSGGADAACLYTMTKRHTSSHLVKILHNPNEAYLPQQPKGDKSGKVVLAADGDRYVQPIHTAPEAYAFSEETVRRYSPSVNVRHNDDALHGVVLDLLGLAGSYKLCPDAKCVIGTALENSPAVYGAQHEPWWYIPSVEGFWLPYIEKNEKNGRLPAFIQYAAAHHVLAKLKCNYEDKNKSVLNGSELERFISSAADVLCHIDDKIIHKWSELNRWTGLKEARNPGFHRCLELIMLREKSKRLGGSLEISARDGDVYFTTPGSQPHKLCRADSECMEITDINYENGIFTIDGQLSCADFMPHEDIRAYALTGNRRISLEEYPIYPQIKCFGVTAAHKYSVHFELPAEVGTKCSFEYELDGQRFPMKILFTGPFSRLVSNIGKSYWAFAKNRCLECPDGRTLRVSRLGGAKHFFKELSFMFSMLRFKGARKLIILGGLGMRMLYRVTKPFYGKADRWVTFDKLYKAGDNGEYFFRYAQTRTDGARTYYLLDKTAPEFKRLRKQYGKRVIASITPRAMLISLNSSVIAATHSTVLSYLGFPKPTQPFFKDLFNFKVACIQHGLTVQQLAQYQNRIFDNTTLYCLASPYEYDNVIKPIYGYEPKHLRMTGLARFDGLHNDDKKFILITPTWRRNVVNAGIAHIKKSHSDAFKGSEYFRLYNTLINDERLIECAKQNGYGIMYLLHPAMSAQKDDFDKNDYVDIVAAAGDLNYEKVLTQASLMVTDYSGVQFDFAYMRKPILYYHPSTLPPQYESGSIDYPTTGFGEICTEHEQLVDELCSFMQNGCENTDFYRERADSFFAFDDYNSCQRIYDEIKSFDGRQ